MTTSGEAPRKKTMPLVIAGVGGCLGLLVIVGLVGAIVWMLRRPDVDGGGGARPAVIDTMDVADGFASDLVRLSGRVVDGDTGALIGDAQVTFLGSDAPDITYTDSDGTYSTHLERGHSYIVSVSAAGYLTGLFPSGFDVDDDTPAESRLEDIELERE